MFNFCPQLLFEIFLTPINIQRVTLKMHACRLVKCASLLYDFNESSYHVDKSSVKLSINFHENQFTSRVITCGHLCTTNLMDAFLQVLTTVLQTRSVTNRIEQACTARQQAEYNI
jgi:hypothetical protein